MLLTVTWSDVVSLKGDAVCVTRNADATELATSVVLKDVLLVVETLKNMYVVVM
jgi:hypothetical protein